MTDRVELRMNDITKAFTGTLAIANGALEAKNGEAVALLGANGAGKSTLMNILGGVLQPDTGTITINGAAVQVGSPKEAAEHGIAFVHQELMMFPTMSVAENIFIDAMPTNGRLINVQHMAARSEELLARLGSDIAPGTPVEQLSIGDRQLVEIARALRQDARIVIFDEPTSSLSTRERKRLFAVIEQLKAENVAIIYITHFLDEVFEVCGNVTVMRNGETVHASSVKDVTPGKIVELMLGTADEGERLRENAPKIGGPLLQVKNMNRAPVLNDVNFEIRAGEIVGLWGLLGSGRTELVRALVGLDPIHSGEIVLFENGHPKSLKPEQLHDHVGFVTEDRRGEGLHLPQSVEQNFALPNLRALLGKFRMISPKKSAHLAEDYIQRLNIKLTGRQQLAGTLSGGNQQKVVVGKWIAAEPDLFILDEPTRGLDVHAKSEILRVVVELARQGKSCLVISSEVEELRRVCDRYLIINRGRLIGELPAATTSETLLNAVITDGQEAA